MKSLFLKILNHAFSPGGGKSGLRDEILEQSYFYLAMRENTPFRINEKTISVLLQESDANIYVCKTAAGCIVKTLLKNELLGLISGLQGLEEVRFYSTVPIHVSFTPQELMGEPPETIPKASQTSHPQPPEPAPEPDSEPQPSDIDLNAEIDLGLQMDGIDPVPSIPEVEEQIPPMDTQVPDIEMELEPPEQTPEPGTQIPNDELDLQIPDPAAESTPKEAPKPDTPSKQEKLSSQPSESALSKSDSQFAGVDEVKKYFSLFDVAARNRIDPGHRFTHINTLVETLYQQNGLNTSDIDKALDFIDNFTSNFIKSAPKESKKKAVIRKYLDFFGLGEYWLFFQDDCPEIKREILNSSELNQQKIRYPAKPYAEKFRLTEICEGRYDGAIIYKVTLTGEKDTVQLFVTNPVKPVLKVGNVYQLLNRDGEERAEDLKRKSEEKIELPSEDEIADILRKVEGKEKGKPVGTERSFEQKRKDKIIFYLKDRLKLQLPSAENKFKEFESDSDILNEFYEYIVNRKFGNLEIQGYTARRLIKELKITEPYEAFHYLLELRYSPGETKQKLKLIEGSLKAKRQEAEKKEKEKKP